MIRVLFFASIRERLKCNTLALEFEPSLRCISELVDRLDQRELPGCAALLLADGALVAVNRTVVDAGHAIVDGDEVAFYPPVTGG
jgi:molybdopterin synthase sulfur carrier subunit